MKNAIITCSDEKYGDFLSDHWIRSLSDNVNLKNIDVVVLDYGLNKRQKTMLSKYRVRLLKCKRDGSPVVIRIRDAARYLKMHKYGQVLTCDGGDMIFQTDISHLFGKDKSEFRAVCEDMTLPFEVFANTNLDHKESSRVNKAIRHKKMINGGFLIAPVKKFLRFAQECERLVKRKGWGIDQVLVNYILYRDGFVELPTDYNFVFTTVKTRFKINKGKFYFMDGRLIPVLHNAGRETFFRPVSDFGYGASRNIMHPLKYAVIRLIMKTYGIESGS